MLTTNSTPTEPQLSELAENWQRSFCFVTKKKKKKRSFEGTKKSAYEFTAGKYFKSQKLFHFTVSFQLHQMLIISELHL